VNERYGEKVEAKGQEVVDVACSNTPVDTRKREHLFSRTLIDIPIKCDVHSEHVQKRPTV
jgi:hypothetical protein